MIEMIMQSLGITETDIDNVKTAINNFNKLGNQIDEINVKLRNIDNRLEGLEATLTEFID